MQGSSPLRDSGRMTLARIAVARALAPELASRLRETNAIAEDNKTPCSGLSRALICLPVVRIRLVSITTTHNTVLVVGTHAQDRSSI